MDPLSVLREFVTSNDLASVVEAGERFQFGDRYSFTKAAPTAYKSQQGRGDFYRLDSLVFFARNRARNLGDLVKASRAAGVQFHTQDRKDLEAYLTGASDASEYIQLAVPELVLPELPLHAEEEKDADAGAPAAKRARTDAEALPGPEGEGGVAAGGEAAILAGLMARERCLRDRNSQLLAPGKSFKRVLDVLAAVQAVQQRAAAAAKPRAALAQPPRSSKKAQPALPVLPSGRFERTAGRDLKAMGMDEFQGLGIEAYGLKRSAADATPPPPPPGAPGDPKPNGAVDAEREAAVRRERQKAKERAAAAAAATAAAAAAAARSSHKRPRPSGRGQERAPTKPGRSGGSVPIIVVPAAATATVNMYNAKKLLEEGAYQTPDAARAAGVRKQSLEVVVRSIGREPPATYHVTDRAPDKASKDWERVVAVFVTGAAWQFKGWPFKGAEEGNTVDTLARMLGVHLSIHGEVLPENVRKWNVRRFELPRDNRHRDRPVVRDIYAALDTFLAAKQSPLAY